VNYTPTFNIRLLFVLKILWRSTGPVPFFAYIEYDFDELRVDLEICQIAYSRQMYELILSFSSLALISNEVNRMTTFHTSWKSI
jgi:hypothetical protein